MKRIFLDTNIILDLLGERANYDSIAKLATLADAKKLKLVASPISFTTTEYILSKMESKSVALERLRKFAILCEVCDANQEIIEKSLNSGFKDFEDAVQYYCALDSKCSVIITRDDKDFSKSSLPIMTAEEYLKSIM
ncbi:type II toxin-antitoxin system VapC family toxin [Flavobacterium silvaticum]|uniref:PIN domain-containing protein n=1 Tax=Flavobacterium silvaticum TaxID=1852020 RepID=A0A972FS39_9FLAO|nr:PIN domain-containing protein [Flavobacterium silvaticum]NMH26510.1 PIN domain-containing protein [Flavobacterium silvaticum]